MKHYEISDWADFVRGLVEPVRREAMERHLAGGCEPCARIAAIFGRVAPLARAEPRCEPPEHAVHCARAIFVLQQPREVRILTRLVGRLVFDSFREPLPAGVRSQQRVSRQTLYEAGEFTVDLRQEHERGGSRISVVGQVASRKEPGRAVAGLPVVLTSGKAVLAKAVCNRFGEFQMEYTPARNLRLEVGAASHGQRPRTSLEKPETQGGLE
jgi:hypothetical protein